MPFRRRRTVSWIAVLTFCLSTGHPGPASAAEAKDKDIMAVRSGTVAPTHYTGQTQEHMLKSAIGMSLRLRSGLNVTEIGSRNRTHDQSHHPTSRLPHSSTAMPYRRINVGIVFPVTFKSSSVFLVVKWKIYSTFSIYFQIRTLESDALLLFSSSGVVEKDFLAVELVNGCVRYTYDTGNGPRSIHSSLKAAVNDNAWHDIGIIRTELRSQVLVVDDCASYDVQEDARSVHFDLNDDLYIGGVPDHMYQALPRQLKSTDGFHGCIASIAFNGKTRNLMQQIVDTMEGSIHGGCDGPSTECQQLVCDNGGVCRQQWNSYTCNCDMTSFTGPSCNVESVAYTFGHSGGLLTFSYPINAWPDTRVDNLAFGFITTQRNAVLVRINSGSSNDYIEVELVDGNISVNYNMGMTDHQVREVYQKVNDGIYHTIRFQRSGANATLQLDNLPVQPKHPTGTQLTTFNHQMKIFVGGRKDPTGVVTKHFEGTIAGLVLNGMRVLEIAVEFGSRVSIEGDVELEVKPLRTTNSPTHAPSSPASSVYNSTLKTTSGWLTRSPEVGSRSPTKAPEFETKRPHSLVTSSESEEVLPDTNHTNKRFISSTRWSTKHLTDLVLSSGAPSVTKIGASPCSQKNCDRVGDKNMDSSLQSPTAGGANVTNAIIERATMEPIQSVALIESHLSTTTSLKDSRQEQISVVTSANSTQVNSSHSSNNEKPETTASAQNDVTIAAGGVVAAGENEAKHSSATLLRNIGIGVGASLGFLILLLLFLLALYKYRSRDEGTYKIDNRNYTYEMCSTRGEENGGVYRLRKLKTKQRKKDVKEWYV